MTCMFPWEYNQSEPPGWCSTDKIMSYQTCEQCILTQNTLTATLVLVAVVDILATLR
jgi:hypothetical protein